MLLAHRPLIVAAAIAALAGAGVAAWLVRRPTSIDVDAASLREYAGVYQWSPDAFIYLQMWNEFAGRDQLVAFEEAGEVRTLYPSGEDRFHAGPGAAVESPVESRVAFDRNAAGAITAFTWQGGDGTARTATRVDLERREDVRLANGEITLAGTLIAPASGAQHPAVILVHGSGPGTRESMLPFARFLVRHGVAVLGYDKRGAGGSSGDWTTAPFEDLAGDVVAAFEYLRSRPDIDATRVGLLGISQAGWVMPLAAVRAPQLAFLISVSGAGVPAAETMIDHARNEMLARGMPPPAVEEMLDVMRAQHLFARTGEAWEGYAAKRATLAKRLGAPPENFPGTPEHPYWRFLRPIVRYDPGPALRQLRVPTLALFGELDNNILAVKNKAAWQAALETGGHPDFTLEILPKANHIMLEAAAGTNAEMASLRRFVPAYAATVREWLLTRLRARDSSAGSS